MTYGLIDPESIKTAVREHYGAAIQQSQASSCCGSTTSAESACCGGSSCCDVPTEQALYGVEELSSLPDDVNTTSFGCGNPLAIASLAPGEVVLDLGSGGGLDVLLSAKRVGAQGHVYGVDMTDAMLEVARQNARKVGATNVEFLKGDIEQIPLPDQHVDVIISNCVINLAPDKGQVLHEAFRVLKPGGRLAVSDIVIDGDLSGLPVNEAQIRAALSWAGCIAGALTRDQYTQFLTEAGFERVEVAVRHRYTSADVFNDIPASLREVPQKLLEEVVGRFTSSSITAYRPL